jgi:hypothetical protein
MNSPVPTPKMPFFVAIARAVRRSDSALSSGIYAVCLSQVRAGRRRCVGRGANDGGLRPLKASAQPGVSKPGRSTPSSARCYGMARVARAWKLSRASVYRSRKETPNRRRGPVGAGSSPRRSLCSAS